MILRLLTMTLLVLAAACAPLESNRAPAANDTGSPTEPATVAGDLPLPGTIEYACVGDPFDPDQLLSSPDARGQDGDVYDTLRETLDEQTGFSEYPPGPWHQTSEANGLATFFAPNPNGVDPDGQLGVYLILEQEGQVWDWAGAGQCRPTAFTEQYGVATWRLAGSDTSTNTTSFTADVTELACAGAQSAEERIQPPIIEYTENSVIVTFFVEPLSGFQECPGNPSSTVEIQLAQPLGARTLLDGAVWPERLPTEP